MLNDDVLILHLLDHFNNVVPSITVVMITSISNLTLSSFVTFNMIPPYFESFSRCYKVTIYEKCKNFHNHSSCCKFSKEKSRINTCLFDILAEDQRFAYFFGSIFDIDIQNTISIARKYETYLISTFWVSFDLYTWFLI